MINNVVLVGRLTKEPELTYTPSGIPQCRFTLAVNRSFSNQNGEREADFIGCIAWRKQAENLANYMKKGSLVGVQGRIQTGSYEGQDGKRIYTTDIVADSIQFLESRGESSTQTPPTQNKPSENAYNTPPRQNGINGHPNPQNVVGGQYGANNAQYRDGDPFNNRGTATVSEDDLPF